MRITRHHWLQLIGTLPLLNSHLKRAFASQQPNPKMPCCMNRCFLAEIVKSQKTSLMDKFDDEVLYYEEPAIMEGKIHPVSEVVIGTVAIQDEKYV